MSKSRAERLEAFEKWADRVQPGELKVAGHSHEIVDKLDDGSEADDEAARPPSTALTGGSERATPT